MAQITFKNEPVTTSGTLPEKSAVAPEFELVGGDLGTVKLSDYAGKRVVLNIFPSLDTDVCAMSVRAFNELAASLTDTVVIAISKDLPFAQGRFCTTEGIKNLVAASAFRSSFGEDYGLTMTSGPLEGLLSRCVVIIDTDGQVIYTEQVPEITQEPNYEAAKAVLQ